MLWQINAAKKMKELLSNIINSEEITLGGSVLNPTELDLYSDVDMKITLSDNTPINITNVLEAIADEFAPVFGYEVISHSRKDAIRLCLDNGMRFDLVFRYPHDKTMLSADTSNSNRIDGLVNQFHFFAAMALVKLGRKDNLIAAHLALEMQQILIGIQMIIRDDNKGTNIHRFGGAEEIPFLVTPKRVSAPVNLNCDTANAVLAILISAVDEMDNALKKHRFEHSMKSDVLAAMIIHFFT